MGRVQSMRRTETVADCTSVTFGPSLHRHRAVRMVQQPKWPASPDPLHISVYWCRTLSAWNTCQTNNLHKEPRLMLL